MKTVMFAPRKIVAGIQEPKPIVGVPAGRQKLRMRPHYEATLFVKTATEIRQFILEDHGAHWSGWEIGRNISR